MCLTITELDNSSPSLRWRKRSISCSRTDSPTTMKSSKLASPDIIALVTYRTSTLAQHLSPTTSHKEKTQTSTTRHIKQTFEAHNIVGVSLATTIILILTNKQNGATWKRETNETWGKPLDRNPLMWDRCKVNQTKHTKQRGSVRWHNQRWISCCYVRGRWWSFGNDVNRRKNRLSMTKSSLPRHLLIIEVLQRLWSSTQHCPQHCRPIALLRCSNGSWTILFNTVIAQLYAYILMQNKLFL